MSCTSPVATRRTSWVAASTWARSSRDLDEEALARGGQLDPTRGPDEELDAELGLQLLDLLGEWGLGDVQPGCRPTEVALLGDGHEVAQVAKLHGVRLRGAVSVDVRTRRRRPGHHDRGRGAHGARISVMLDDSPDLTEEMA